MMTSWKPHGLFLKSLFWVIGLVCNHLLGEKKERGSSHIIAIFHLGIP
jgi:hypothetical protein